MIRQRIEGRTTMGTLVRLLTAYGLTLTRVHWDGREYLVTLGTAERPIVVGLGPTFPEALEDAFADLDAMLDAELAIEES